MAAQLYNERKNDGLELWVVLGETIDFLEPSLAYCMAYADSHGMNPDNLYVDYNAETNRAWDTLFQYIAPGTQDIALPWEAIVEGGEMTYIWNTVTGSGTYGQVIDELLVE